MELFNLGFVTVRLVDLIDISVVTFIFFKLYELLRGSLALRIIVAILMVFILWKIVDLLDMLLLKSILDEFLGVGAIAVIIIFASEIRRFLLLIGKNSFFSRAWQQLFANSEDVRFAFNDLVDAMEAVKENKLGALVVLTGQDNLERFKETGDKIGALVSQRVLLSFFLKDSPLHDGAVIIDRNEISAARCVLPLSKDPNLPAQLGLRHRAALGIAEVSDALTIIVSEERQEISLAVGGALQRNVDLITLEGALREHYAGNRAKKE